MSLDFQELERRARARESALRLHAVLVAFRPSLHGTIEIAARAPHDDPAVAIARAWRQVHVREAARRLGFGAPEPSTSPLRGAKAPGVMVSAPSCGRRGDPFRRGVARSSDKAPT